MSVDYLKYAVLEITSVCNLKCRHCYNFWKQEKNNTQEIFQNSYKKAFRILDYLLKNTSVEHITFTGGEPTISERFIELVLHAKLNGRRVTVISNGNGPDEIYKQLFALNIDMLELSVLSSNAEIHDRITGKTGSWKRAVSVMKGAIAQGIKVTPVIVITNRNSETIISAIRMFYNMGLSGVMVNRYNIGGEGLNQGETLSVEPVKLRSSFPI